ncbi:hypothetical protein [Veillonella montpellierensis]|uniref:hypothetical protein n=1 Tax=Veillonella montpellierensis TaxID=187328 RepID=UPI0023F9A184|nr:hypothetical protein [Veillonella montpellierensis]
MVLQSMHNKGYRYIARNEDGNVHVYKTLPEKKCSYWTTGDLFIRLFIFAPLFDDVTFEDGEPLDIAKELGITDWSKVPIDTKVLASNDGKKWEKRHFKEYREDKRNPFVVYAYGLTSWSATGEHAIRCKYCKLAEE